MFKTLHQNKVLHDGKPSFLFLTLILNSLKEFKTVSLISLPVNFCRVQTTMSRKKVQQLETPRFPKPSPSTPKSTSQAKNPASQLVPVPPTAIANCYLVSTIPKPNYKRPSLGQPSYSSTLVTPTPRVITLYTVEEPFGPIQPQKSSPYLPRKGRSSYVKKPFIQHISYIEPHLVHIKDPLALAMEVLPPKWHFLPKHPEKNIKFYKSILIQEKSAQIENIMNKGDPSVVLYHKFIITGFVSYKEWGRHPLLLKQLQVSSLSQVQNSITIIMTT